jgi:hypothetical protein
MTTEAKTMLMHVSSVDTWGSDALTLFWHFLTMSRCTPFNAYGKV